MSTTPEELEEAIASPDISLRFQLSAIIQYLKELPEKIWSRLENRRPDNQPVTDGDGSEGLQEAIGAFARAVEIMAEQRHGGNHGGIDNRGGGNNNNKLFNIVQLILGTVISVLLGYILSSLSTFNNNLNAIGASSAKTDGRVEGLQAQANSMQGQMTGLQAQISAIAATDRQRIQP